MIFTKGVGNSNGGFRSYEDGTLSTATPHLHIMEHQKGDGGAMRLYLNHFGLELTHFLWELST